MLQTRLAKALLIAPAILLLPLAERPVLNAEKGTSVDKTLTTSIELQMVSATVSIMGEERDMGEDELFALSLEAIQEVTDVYGGSEDGRLQSIDRTYTGMEMSYEADEESGDMDGFDKIENETVRFTRGEDGWSKSFVVDEGEDSPSDDLLEGLLADMDLSVLLPSEDVEEGGSWTVSEVSFRSLFFPGGMPTGDEPAGEMASLVFDDLAPQFAENTSDFSIECTLVGEASGIAEITFKYSGSSTIDAAEFVMSMTRIAEEDDEGSVPDDADAEMEVDFEGEGTLLWNMKGGHVHAFDMSQTAEALLSLSFTQDFGDQPVDIELEGDFSMDMAWELEVAEAE